MVNEELAYYFNSTLTKGRKDNTYKFALARFLIDYAHGLDDSFIRVKIEKDEKEIIRYSTIAKEFLKYYWHQAAIRAVRYLTVNKHWTLIRVETTVYSLSLPQE